MKAIAAALLLLLTSTAAMAQREPLRPAPVPDANLQTVNPSDRAGRSDAADSSAPFAAAPTGTETRARPIERTVPSSLDGGLQTPNLSR